MNLATKERCTGCAACANICSMNAIQMREDIDGFLFPEINRDLCIHCNKCENVCPANNVLVSDNVSPKAYIAQNKDENVLRESTSGGAFTAIASQVLAVAGSVYGAAFDTGYVVRHQRIECLSGLKRFRNSKYVQSVIGDSFRLVKNDLESGRNVCFSGTPCQVQGLLKYLGKTYNNLIVVDFVCHAIPSPKIFKKYVEYQKSNNPEFNELVFRDKSRGYSYSTMALYDSKGKCLYQAGSEIDPFFRMFLGGYCNRLSCHKCTFQTGKRASDFTLWDCWDPSRHDTALDNNKGVTYIVAWTKKSQDLLDKCNEQLYVREISMESVKNVYIRKDYPMSSCNRSVFFTDADKYSAKDFIQKYVPVGGKYRIKSYVRSFLYKIHLHDEIRKIVHMIRHF